MGNSNDGVLIETNASSNTIGGISSGEGNVIWSNAGVGVRILSGTNNSIRKNAIGANGGLGIDLGPNGVTANDLNGNGIRDTLSVTVNSFSQEPSLSGWTIELDAGANGTVDGTKITDANGNYAFTGLEPNT